MKGEVLEQIKQQFGDRATDSRFECSLYSRDLAPVPALLVNPLFNTMPDLIVRPADADEVAGILKLAYANHIPITPRAGASTVYFDSVPVKGGIVMDLNLIKGVVGLDEAGMTVTVKAGTTWSELDEYLNARGLALKSFPSSAPVATIGGWFCMMGYGIGSMKYGSLVSQVKAIEIVLPSGEIRQLTRDTDPPLDWLVASEGTLGIITQLEVEIRKLNLMKHFLIRFSDLGVLGKAMTSIIKAEVIPYNLHFADDRCSLAMQALGMAPPNTPPAYTLGIDYEGSAEELKQAQEFINALVGADKATHPVAAETAELEWEEKFKALRLKRGGPSVLGGEIWLPVKELPGYLADIQKMAHGYGIDLISYGHVVTPEQVTVMTMFYADETKTIKYIINLSLVKKIQDVGYRHGGYPYGVGLWNTPYIGRMFSAPSLAELRQRKRKLDSRGIMNPGKVYRSPIMLNPFNFTVGMNVLAGVKRITRRRDRR